MTLFQWLHILYFLLYSRCNYWYESSNFHRGNPLSGMQLKRLEISGFKSFRDKVSFDFSQGVSAIVGPNGCGKSNVVDALRWVMGEQRVKSLRGKKMDDVIFNGSQDASPIGVAEVSMVLTCGNGQVFPGLYAGCTEVSVSRKLFRDGDSEYAINRIPCRLLDVKEFFLGTGVGSRTYSLVEQNSVAGLVEAKPEDRRQFIEEAAGVSKYKSRKEAAARKMEATKQNLVRLNDVLREVKNQLNAISRQAKRAEQYRALKASIKEDEVALAAHSYRGLLQEKTGLEQSRQGLETQAADSENTLLAHEGAAEAVKLEMVEQEARKSNLQEELYQTKNQIHLKEQAIEFSRSKAEDLRLRHERNEAELEESHQRLEAIAEEQGRLEDAGKDLEEKIAHAQGGVNVAESENEDFRQAERDLQKRIDEQKVQYIDLAAEKAKLKNMGITLTRTLDDLKRRQDREERDLSENRQRLDKQIQQLTAVRQALAEDEEALDVLTARRDTADDEQERTQTELRELNDSVTGQKEDLSRKTSRLQSLKEFHEGYAWCSDATKSLMTAGDGKNEHFSREHFVGLVADCLAVPPVYEAAVEAVLGEKLQYIIVKSHDDGVQAIDYLKTAALGRSSFVPVEIRNGKPDKKEWEHLRSAVRLIEHIDIEENYREIAEYLLGDVLLIPDLRTGLSLWSQNGFRGTFVTSDGDMISPHGVLTGGSNNNGERSLLKDKREIRDLECEVEDLTVSLREATENKQRLTALMNQWRDELALAAGELHRTELRLNGRRKDVERLEGDKQRMEQTIRTLEFNRDGLLREEAECRANLQKVEESTAQQAARETDMNAAMAELQYQWEAIRQQLGEKEQALTQSKVLIASLVEKRRSFQKELEGLNAERSLLLRKIENAAMDQETALRQIEEINRGRDADAAELADLYKAFYAQEAVLIGAKDVQQNLEAKLKEWEVKIRDAKKNRDHLADWITKTAADEREMAYQMDSLCRMIQEKYSIELASQIEETEVLTEADVQARTEQVRKNRQAVEAFGEVNLLAINEYSDLKERHDFLTAQAADLNGSLAALQRTISRINRISRERFAETFEAVNRCFQDVFARIFPGGKGELRLTDESDLLETGVDIEIQIPGKRQQNITLLSGGEKSLAALALILAIILYRPTPFLVLDEVDAALDDANVILFANLVKEISNDSQVIMVTHNKNSMEVATSLYGVTMQKKGISTAVSVNLN